MRHIIEVFARASNDHIHAPKGVGVDARRCVDCNAFLEWMVPIMYDEHGSSEKIRDKHDEL